jgi:hypothetical protein
MVSCVDAISIENTATGKPVSSATFSAILRAKEVLPIDGRPATITRSPGWRPEVIASKSEKPVGTPVTSLAPAVNRSSIL